MKAVHVSMALFPTIFTRMETAFVENEIELTENAKMSWIKLHCHENPEEAEAAEAMEKFTSDWKVSIFFEKKNNNWKSYVRASQNNFCLV